MTDTPKTWTISDEGEEVKVVPFRAWVLAVDRANRLEAELAVALSGAPYDPMPLVREHFDETVYEHETWLDSDGRMWVQVCHRDQRGIGAKFVGKNDHQTRKAIRQLKSMFLRKLTPVA